MKKSLVVLLLLLALAPPALGWDKAPTPQKRLEILAGASKRLDQGELASCFAPPFDSGVMQNLLQETFDYEGAVSKLYKTTGDKLAADGLGWLGDQKDAVTALHYVCGTTVTFDSVKEEPDKAVAHVKFVDKDESFNGELDLLLVKVGDDWRIVLDHEPWPASLSMDPVSALASDLNKATSTLNTLESGIREDKFTTKEQVGDPFAMARGLARDAWTKLRDARSAAAKAEKDKAAALVAEQARKEKEAADKAAADEAAKKEAAKKEAAEKAAKEAAAKAPPPPPPAAKKPAADEEEKPPEPDNTGTYIVFGLLAVACLVTVGVLLSKLRGEKKGGGGRSGGGSKRSRPGGGSSSGSGRQRRRR